MSAETKDPVKELAELEELVQRFGASSEPSRRLQVARAFFAKGNLLRDMGQVVAALQAWDEVIKRVADDPPPGGELIALDALYNQANLLGREQRTDEAVGACDELIDRYGHDRAEYVQMTVGQTMRMRMSALIDAGQHEPVVAAADQLLERFGDSLDPELRASIIHALMARTVVEYDADRRGAAIAASDVLIARFERERDPRRMAIVGDALGRAAGVLLGRKPLGRFRRVSNERNKGCREQAMRILELLRARLQDAEDRDLQKLLVRVLIDIGDAHAGLGRLGQSFTVFEQVYEMGEPALEVFREENERGAGGNKARLAVTLEGEVEVLERLGRSSEADAKRKEIIERSKGDWFLPMKWIAIRARRRPQ